MKLRFAVPALTLAMALASLPALAQGHRGGGSRGGHGGGSYRGPSGTAVARHPSARPSSGGMHQGSRPGYAPRGSVAQQRHPRAGTGTYGGNSGYYRGGKGHYRGGNGYYRGGNGYYRGGHGYYRGGHGYYHYRPYYGYRGYYPYSYSSYYWPGVSLGFGWDYGSSWPYYAGAYYGGPGYSVGVYVPDVVVGGDDGEPPPPPARATERSYEGPSGRVRLEVRPDDASVYVDDEFRGTAREARILRLSPGRHRIELVRPGFATEQREVTVVSGESQDVLVELVRP